MTNNESELILKIGDFGWAKKSRVHLPAGNQIGTANYTSPEAILDKYDQGYHLKTDVW